MARFTFHLETNQDRARTASLKFDNGIEVKTPIFMPVGTVASVKAINQQELKEIGYNLILANTYHVYLRPGVEVLEKFGNLKKFMNWDGLLLTDSGGYQAFSLSGLSKYKPEGVYFQSHIDGSRHLFSPQNVLDIQARIGSDIVMPIDDCAPFPAEPKRLRESLKRTHDWILLSKDYWQNSGYSQEQSLFGIVQGGIDLGLRRESAQFMAEQDLPGYSIGGLSVGEKNDDFLSALAESCDNLPPHKPRYLMGVGSIPEIIRAVALGVDMFDCVLPTRNARNGQAFTSQGKVNLRNEKHRFSDQPMDPNCSCFACRHYSVGYIRHLHKAQEILALNLTTLHNLHFMKTFMYAMRQSIQEQKFGEFQKHWLAIF